jgi:hypothetical protein
MEGEKGNAGWLNSIQVGWHSGLATTRRCQVVQKEPNAHRIQQAAAQARMPACAFSVKSALPYLVDSHLYTKLHRKLMIVICVCNCKQFMPPRKAPNTAPSYGYSSQRCSYTKTPFAPPHHAVPHHPTAHPDTPSIGTALACPAPPGLEPVALRGLGGWVMG